MMKYNKVCLISIIIWCVSASVLHCYSMTNGVSLKADKGAFLGSLKKCFTKEHILSLLKTIKKEGIEGTKIVLGSISAAVLYGISQDQITARICLEYFSKSFHKKMIDKFDGPLELWIKGILENTNSPTIYGLIWGTIATWWFGALLGIPLAISCRFGSWPKLNLKDMVKPIAYVLGMIAVSSFCAGTYGLTKCKNDSSYVKKFGPLLSDVSAEHKIGFIVNAYAHHMAYASGALGGLGCIGYALYIRYQKKREMQKMRESNN